MIHLKGVVKHEIGYESRRKRNDQFDYECKEALQEENEAYRQLT